MNARLFCRVGELRGADFGIEGEATVGRGAANAVRLEAQDVSDSHARIAWDEAEGCYVLEDLGSTNGTELDGLPVERRQRLGHLHVITFSRVHSFIFHHLRHQEPAAAATVEPPADSAPPESSTDSRPKTMIGEVLPVPQLGGRNTLDGELPALPSAIFRLGDQEAAPAPAQSHSLEIEIDGEWTRFPLGKGETSVGRFGADIVIQNPDISRIHAVFTLLEGEVKVRDAGSTNKTFLDGAEVAEDTVLRSGQEVKLGSTRARLITE